MVERPRAAASSRSAPERPPCVLIVDDVADQREMYAEYLEAKGFHVETASDGAAAIATALRVVPDLIVMDLSMPRLDGWEATRRLKRELSHDVPIVACTGFVLGAAAERALDAGCDAFIMKPCLPEDLLREIRLVLARFAGRRP
jgi:CheY-like chemotaxis protein